MKQWKESIERFTNSSLIQLLHPKKPIDKNCQFYIVNAQNVCKFKRSDLLDIGACIVDEIHLIIGILLWKV